MKNFYIVTIILFLSYLSKADPGTYYNNVDTNKTCSALKTELFNKISTNTIALSYGSMDDYYFKTDSKPSEINSNNFVIVDRYCSDRPNGIDSCNFKFITNFCSSGGTFTYHCACYVKEHTFPSSWFNDQLPMRSDMHFVFPADNYTNNEKSNYPLGYVQTPTLTSYNGTKIGTSNTVLNYGFNATHVFEPIDSFKGDFARAYLYVVTRYETLAATWINNSSANDVLAGNIYPSFDSWILQLCVKWHKLDPPSSFEKKRNDSIFSIQGNRNPFVDFPSLVEKTFGVNGSASCTPTAIRNNKTIDYTIYPNPVNNLLNIQLPNTVLNKPATIELVDLVGKIILQQEILLDNDIELLDVSNLTKGIYMINIKYEGQNNVSKFIKQ